MIVEQVSKYSHGDGLKRVDNSQGQPVPVFVVCIQAICAKWGLYKGGDDGEGQVHVQRRDVDFGRATGHHDSLRREVTYVIAHFAEFPYETTRPKKLPRIAVRITVWQAETVKIQLTEVSRNETMQKISIYFVYVSKSH